MNKAVSKVSRERVYDIIRLPIVTEKSTAASSVGCVTFRVPLDATKSEVRAAVEDAFGVTVVCVNTSILKGKVKRFRGRLGRRSDIKKAFVKLADGCSIDIAAGV